MPRAESIVPSMNICFLEQEQDIVVGSECLEKVQNLHITYPISNGLITNWEDMEQIWRFAFNEKLGVDPANTQVMLSESPLNLQKNRERLFESMFECFGFQSALVQVQPILTLYAQGTPSWLNVWSFMSTVQEYCAFL